VGLNELTNIFHDMNEEDTLTSVNTRQTRHRQVQVVLLFSIQANLNRLFFGSHKVGSPGKFIQRSHTGHSLAFRSAFPMALSDQVCCWQRSQGNPAVHVHGCGLELIHTNINTYLASFH
jgi:hypothetical protein